MRLSIEAVLDYTIDGAADVLLLIEAAAGPDQRIEQQDLRLWCAEPWRAVAGEDGIGQRCWARGEGGFRAEYRAIVDIVRPAVDLAALPFTPPRMLPAETIPYLLPSRYCESDRLEGFVVQAFGNLSGGALAAALATWVKTNLRYQSGSSSGVTTALMTFGERRGVCRDYAHLLVALARAGGIPARCVSAYAPGVDPPDFHAVAELWLAGSWHLVDPTGMACPADLVRVAVGRDATDIAFMTVFGTAWMNTQSVRITQLDEVTREQAPAADGSTPGTIRSTTMTDDAKPIDDDTLDTMSVAPGGPEADPAAGAPEDDNDHVHHPRQDAGQDASILARLQNDPENPEAQLDNALDESMDASDPPATTQPGHGDAPAVSSGFDEDEERRLRGGK